MRPTRLSILVLALATPAWAQDSEADRFREVEAGFEDTSPQAVSTLVRPVDMRVPTNFERVYEVLGSGGMYARRAGAVTAVFDRSLYAGSATPLIPAGTVFYLGSLPVDLGRPGLFSPVVEAGLGAADRPDTASRPTPAAGAPVRAERMDLRVGKVMPQASVSPTPEGGSMWTSESYRQRRIGDLVRGAAWRIREAEAARAREHADRRPG
jgi:hypothetical protein